jgi:hypothetical protein
MSVDGLVEVLRSPDPSVRWQAAEQLAQLGEGAQAAAVGLVQAAGDPEERVRQWATAALEALGPPPASDRERLTALLAAPQADVVYWAATLLGRLAADAAPAVAELAHVVRAAPDAAARQRAVWALGQIGPPAASARDTLERAAQDSDVRLARLARQSLERIVA